MGEKLMLDIQEKTVFPEQMKLIEEHKEHFKFVIRARKDDWVEEYQYWIDKGWLEG